MQYSPQKSGHVQSPCKQSSLTVGKHLRDTSRHNQIPKNTAYSDIVSQDKIQKIFLQIAKSITLTKVEKDYLRQNLLSAPTNQVSNGASDRNSLNQTEREQYEKKLDKLKKQLDRNMHYVEKLQQKYEILLQSIDPSEEKVKIEKLVQKINKLSNLILNYQQKQLLSVKKPKVIKTIKLSEPVRCQIPSQSSKSENNQSNQILTEKNTNPKTIKLSESVLCQVPSQDSKSEEQSRSRALSVMTQQNNTNKNERFRKQSQGVQHLKSKKSQNQSLKDYCYYIKKETIGNFVCLEQMKESSIYFNLKRKDSQAQSTERQNWQKIITAFLKGQNGSQTFKAQTISQISKKKTVPHELRSTVWPMIFENRLGITSQLYIELIQQREKGWILEDVKIQIQKDIRRSFSGRGSQLDNKDKLANDIRQVLELFHMYRPDISYIQGMTYPAIVLTTIVGKMKAFCIISNLILCIPFFKRLYTFEGKYPSIYCRTFDLLLKQANPATYQLLQKRQIHSQIYLFEWFYTFFSRGISFKSILKIWDHIAYFDEIAIFKMALSVIQLVSCFLERANYDECISLIKQYGSYIDEEKLIETFLVNNKKINEEKYKKAYRKALKMFQN